MDILYSKLLKFFSSKDRTSKEVFEFLTKSGVGDSDIAFFISKLKSQNVLNENRYTENYIRSKSQNLFWGKEKIQFHLNELEIPKEVILTEFEKFSDEYFFEIGIKYILKKKNQMTTTKLKNHLITKGFEENLIVLLFKKLEIPNIEITNYESI